MAGACSAVTGHFIRYTLCKPGTPTYFNDLAYTVAFRKKVFFSFFTFALNGKQRMVSIVTLHHT